jgi:hypothetical protein
MDGKIEFLTILLLSLSVSALTSYATTSLYLTSTKGETPNVNPVDIQDLPPQMVQEISDEIVLELT